MTMMDKEEIRVVKMKAATDAGLFLIQTCNSLCMDGTIQVIICPNYPKPYKVRLRLKDRIE